MLLHSPGLWYHARAAPPPPWGPPCARMWLALRLSPSRISGWGPGPCCWAPERPGGLVCVQNKLSVFLGLKCADRPLSFHYIDTVSVNPNQRIFFRILVFLVPLFFFFLRKLILLILF